MPRQTSREAYDTIVKNGMLSKRRFQVYHTLFFSGPLTAGEITALINTSLGMNVQLNSISPRLAEMERSGAVTSVGERACTVTGHNAIIWDVTGKLPNRYEQRQPKRKFWIVKNQIGALTACTVEGQANNLASINGGEVIRVVER
jgi:hypothetical protein